MDQDQKEIYKNFFDSLGDIECKRIVCRAIGEENFAKRSLMAERTKTGSCRVYIGVVQNNHNKSLSADLRCPYFEINHTIQIIFNKGRYVEENAENGIEPLIEENIDYLSAYNCLTKILKEDGILA